MHVLCSRQAVPVEDIRNPPDSNLTSDKKLHHANFDFPPLPCSPLARYYLFVVLALQHVHHSNLQNTAEQDEASEILHD